MQITLISAKERELLVYKPKLKKAFARGYLGQGCHIYFVENKVGFSILSCESDGEPEVYHKTKFNTAREMFAYAEEKWGDH